MFEEDFLRRALIAAPAILFALTVHEFFHAWTALRFGDPTARDQGRLTLNPIAHIDLMGLAMMFLSGFRFGWAKPVPVNPFNLRGNWRVADFWISAAGPLSNLGLGLIFGIILRILFALNPDIPHVAYQFVYFCVSINVALAFFNLIPIFPLDGSHILRSILPESSGQFLDSIQPYSPIILLGLIITGGVWLILGGPVSFVIYLFAGV